MCVPFVYKSTQVHRQEAVANLLKVVDAHSISMALKVYNVTTWADDAKIAQILYEDVMGDQT